MEDIISRRDTAFEGALGVDEYRSMLDIEDVGKKKESLSLLADKGPSK